MVDLLATAVEAVEQAEPRPWILVEDEPPADLPPPDLTTLREPGPPPKPPGPTAPSGIEHARDLVPAARRRQTLSTALWWALIAAILVALAWALAHGLGAPPQPSDAARALDVATAVER